LDDNKLTAIHPKTFSHLTKLRFLLLAGNDCIDRNFMFSRLDVIEEGLAVCGANYPAAFLEN
jgi:hypothetical protein